MKHIELSEYLNGHWSRWNYVFSELGSGQSGDWTCLSGGWMTGRVGGVTLSVYLTHLAEFHAALTKYSDNWPPYPLYKSSLAPLPCQLLKGTFRPVWRGSGPIQRTQTRTQKRFNVGPASSTLARHWTIFRGTWGSKPSPRGGYPFALSALPSCWRVVLGMTGLNTITLVSHHPDMHLNTPPSEFT